MNEYLVIYEQAEDGAWGAYLPDIDGVVALGKTREEVEARMRESFAVYLELMREDGLPLPEPRNSAGLIAA